MRRFLGILLALAIVATTACFVAAPVQKAKASVERTFVIDGKKDYWYLDGDEYVDQYYWDEVDAWQGPTGHDPYFPNNDEDHAWVWTAYDYDYIYVLVKVHNLRYPYMMWDDSLQDFDDPENSVNSSIVDSIAIWMDQDPYTQVDDWFFENTKDPNQSDSQFRYLIANRAWHDLHNIPKRGFPLSFHNYLKAPGNTAVVLNDDDENGVPDGYSLEIRYPRNHDLDPEVEIFDCYHFNVVCNFSACDTDDNYCMALAPNWWISYTGTPKIYFNDEDNPFIGPNRADPTYDEAVQNVINLVDALPAAADITEADKANVNAAYDAYQALTADQKDQFPATSYAKLIACREALPVGDVKYGDVDGDDLITSKDAQIALQASVTKVTLSEDAEIRCDVDGDKKITSKDSMSILQRSVNKISKFPVEG